MTEMSVLVIDDEPLARRRILRLLAKYPWVGRVDEAANVAQAVAIVAARPPDIMLLDIQMPGGDGFDILAAVAEAPPAVVFVTAFDHHALRAFENNAVDYVTKPIEPGRSHLAIERARAAAGARLQSDRIAELQETLHALKQALGRENRKNGEFWVRTHGEYLRIPADDIIRFQADRDYVRLHIADGDYLYQESLASLERRLDPARFLRIHRSTIVQRSAIERIKQMPFASLVAVLTDGTEVRVGRTYTPAIRSALSA